MIDNKLSKYPSGSVREILHIAIPLMIASFSFHFMLVVDRAILAKYSVISFNAATVISMAALVFQFISINITSMAEVLAGQFYGSKKFEQVAKPVWQMIYFALFMLIPFSLIGFYGADIFVPEQYGQEGKNYFLCMMLFAVMPSINTAIASFFIARGKTFVISVSTVIANILNVLIAYPLILGWEGVVEPQGLLGSAYAAMISFSFQILIMLSFFLSKKNIKEFDVLNISFDFPILKRCLKIGVPNAIGHGAELLAYASILRYLSSVSEDHITVSAIAQNFFIIIVFFTEAVQKSMIAVSANAIGAKTLNTISIAIKSVIKLVFVFTFIVAIPFLFFPELTISIFFNEISDEVFKLASIALIGSLMFFFIDTLAWGTFSAVLTAGGDTKALMIINIINSWCFNFLPVVLFVNANTPAYFPWLVIIPFYALCNFIAFGLRYKYGKWRQNLTKD